MAQQTIFGGSLPVEVPCNGGIVSNDGPGTVFYADSQDVSVTSYEGSLAAGAATPLEGTQWFVTSGVRASVTVTAPPSQSLASAGSGQRLATFGHSYNDPNYMVGVTRRADLFGQSLATLVGMDEDNYCVSGSYSIQGTYNAYDRVLNQLPAIPTTPPLRSPVNAAAIYSGHNDISPSLQPDMATEPSILVDFFRAMIRRLRSGCAAHVSAAPMVLAGGTWSTTSSSSWFGGSLRFATANGCTWTLTLPATFPGGTVEIWGMRNSATGAVHTITVDGVANTTWDTRGATTTSNRPTYKPITGLSPGTHVIVGTISNLVGAVEHLNYWQIPHPDPAPVVYANVCRTPAAANGQTDNVVATFMPLLAAIATEFPDGRVVCVNADAILNKDATLFGDGTHPNARGGALLADGFATALLPLLGRRARVSIAADAAVSPAVTHGFFIDESADPRSGVVTLISGTLVITSRAFQANARVFLQPIGSSATMGSVVETARVATNNLTAGTLTITSKDPSGATVTGDTRQVAWFVVQPA